MSLLSSLTFYSRVLLHLSAILTVDWTAGDVFLVHGRYTTRLDWSFGVFFASFSITAGALGSQHHSSPAFTLTLIPCLHPYTHLQPSLIRCLHPHTHPLPSPSHSSPSITHPLLSASHSSPSITHSRPSNLPDWSVFAEAPITPPVNVVHSTAHYPLEQLGLV